MYKCINYQIEKISWYLCEKNILLLTLYSLMLIYRVCPTYDWEVIIKCLIVLIHFLTLRPGKNRVLRVPQLVHVHCKYIDLYVYVILKIKSKRRGKTRWFRCKAHTLAAICCEWSDWMDIFFLFFIVLSIYAFMVLWTKYAYFMYQT